MSETEVEVEDYEEIVGDLYYDDSVEAVPNADSFQEPTLNQNVSSLTPKNRPILRSSNLSLAGDLQESIPKVVIKPVNRYHCCSCTKSAASRRLKVIANHPSYLQLRSLIKYGRGKPNKSKKAVDIVFLT